MSTSYVANIGLEVHIQLNTSSKIFCSDDIRFGADPNLHISSLSLGYPGTLPVFNQKVLQKAITLAVALSSNLQATNYFDRKSYFYPDLPKGYQITQDNAPYCKGGHLDIVVNQESKKIRIHHIHMEEDAGKSIHDIDPNNSMIDLNRAGTPLLELVTEPDLATAEDAYAFILQLRKLVRYYGISDGNMEEGSMRCDCNVSIRKKGDHTLGNRCEIKNVNSMRFAKKAIEYEIQRQTKVLESGGAIKQSTLNYDPEKNTTSVLREKEYADDYRYFPDPDLPQLHITTEMIEEIKLGMPPHPQDVRKDLIEQYHLSIYSADLLHFDIAATKLFKEIAVECENQQTANFIINKVLPYCQENGCSIAEFPLTIDQIVNFLQLIDENQVSNSAAYQKLLPTLLQAQNQDVKTLAKNLDLIIVSSVEGENSTRSIMQNIIEKNPNQVTQYRKGKKGLIGFFMGRLMAETGGKVDAKKAKSQFEELLNSQ